jgi:hypothetical protein
VETVVAIGQLVFAGGLAEHHDRRKLRAVQHRLGILAGNFGLSTWSKPW